MPYVRPQGGAVRFVVDSVGFPRPYHTLGFAFPSGSYSAPVAVYAVFEGVDFPRPYNALGFKFFGEKYKAPHGLGIHVVSGVLRNIPPGDRADFSIGEALPTIVRRSATTTMPWARPRQRVKTISSTFRSVLPETCRVDGSWAKGRANDDAAHVGWGALNHEDAASFLAWSNGGEMVDETKTLPWFDVLSFDRLTVAAWEKFIFRSNTKIHALWVGSSPSDKEKNGGWSGLWMIATRVLDYLAPRGSSASFLVHGGGVDCAQFGADSYIPPGGSGVIFEFIDKRYSPPFIPLNPELYVRPSGRRANFIYAPDRVRVQDANGHDVFGRSARDSDQSLSWWGNVRRDTNKNLPWVRYSRALNPGWGIVVPSGPAKPGNGSSIIIPIKRYYIMANEVFLLRIEDNMMIPATDLSISFDRDSWCHQFSATVPYDYLDAVMPSPAPVKVAVFINGTEFRFLIRRPAWNRVFAKSSVGLSGYGVACEIDTPYVDESYRTNDVAMTAQQLIDAALEYSTYTQDWQISDWLVPAGALSMTGSPIAVANHVADAAGAVLSADWSQNILRMMPRYPVKPWDWDTAVPDYVIPASVAESESGELVENTEYNAVFISGIEQGIIGRVRRSGTAGDLVAPMVTHPLICHPVAAEQKGGSVLGASGQRVIRQITMPVLDEIGIVEQCRLIEFSDGSKTHRGVTCANNISASWPAVRQTITVETLT